MHYASSQLKEKRHSARASAHMQEGIGTCLLSKTRSVRTCCVHSDGMLGKGPALCCLIGLWAAHHQLLDQSHPWQLHTSGWGATDCLDDLWEAYAAKCLINTLSTFSCRLFMLSVCNLVAVESMQDANCCLTLNVLQGQPGRPGSRAMSTSLRLRW